MSLQRCCFALFLFAPLLVAGCASKAVLDDKATALTVALQKKDRAAFDALVAPTVSGEVSPGKFETLAVAIGAMGPVVERNMHGINVNNGVSEGNYTLVCEKGEVNLKLKLTPDDRIVAFNYEGEALNRAADEALAAKFNEFKVYEFTFLVDEKTANPNGNKYKKGQRAAFGIILGGVKAKDGQQHVEVDLAITNAKGKKVFKKEKFLNLTGEAGPIPKLGIYAFVDAPKPGNYQLNFKFRDVAGGQELDYGQAIVVTKK